ncbi:MAG: sulfurtransferase [Nitrospirae bacterium]|nr:sulfurtransferase [Nitrospirota bacterium]
MLFSQQTPSLHPLCAGCHQPEPNVIMGVLDSVSIRGRIIQLDLNTHKEIIKYEDSVAIKNIGSIHEMEALKGKAFRIDYTVKKNEKFATTITRFDVLKTIKPEDKLTKEDFKKLIAERKDLVIVDTRPLPRYEEGHIPGAIVIPAAAFDKNTDKLPKEKERPLVFYCVGGCSSPLAAVKAKALGYTNVKVYIGGIPDWIQTEYTHVTPKWLRDSIEKDIPHVLIDTRSKDAVEKGHIKGTVSITYDELEGRKNMFPKQKLAPVVFYGDKAMESAAKVISWGYKGAKVLPVSFEAWQSAGNPVNTGAAKTAISYIPKSKPGTILIEEFKKIAKSIPPDTVIVDVRDRDEYKAGHIKGAINIPVDELADRVSEIPRDKKVLLQCTSGLRAEMAYHILIEKGLTNALCLDAHIFIDADGNFTIME